MLQIHVLNFRRRKLCVIDLWPLFNIMLTCHPLYKYLDAEPYVVVCLFVCWVVCLFVLFRFVLFCFVLSCFVLFCLVLFCFCFVLLLTFFTEHIVM